MHFILPDGTPMEERVDEFVFDLEDGEPTHMDVEMDIWPNSYFVVLHQPKLDFDPNGGYGISIANQ